MKYRIKPVHFGLLLGMLLLLVAGFGCKAAGPRSVTGKAGSMARFLVKGNVLYTLGNYDLRAFSIKDRFSPVKRGHVRELWGAETLFGEGDHLFVGSQRGLYVLSAKRPEHPRKVAFHRHATACDPVVVQGKWAFVTLRQGSRCRRGPNELQVLDVSQRKKPVLKRKYPMNGPAGLGIDGHLLFVADGHAGIKLFDARKPLSLRLLTTLHGVDGYDLIPHEGVLIVSAKRGLYQYSYGAFLQSGSLNTASKRVLRRLSVLPVRP